MKLKKSEVLTASKLKPYIFVVVKLPKETRVFVRSATNPFAWGLSTDPDKPVGAFKYSTEEVVLKANTYNLVPGVSITLQNNVRK